jgi:hypothetical protein
MTTYIIISTLCVFAFGVRSFDVFLSTQPNLVPKNVACTPVATYRISDSSATVEGETVYEVIPR